MKHSHYAVLIFMTALSISTDALPLPQQAFFPHKQNLNIHSICCIILYKIITHLLIKELFLVKHFDQNRTEILLIAVCGLIVGYSFAQYLVFTNAFSQNTASFLDIIKIFREGFYSWAKNFSAPPS